MVNVHVKYPEGAINGAAYSTDGSNVRDATEEEKVRYRNADKHRRKGVEEKSSANEPSQNNTAAPAKARLMQHEPTGATVTRRPVIEIVPRTQRKEYVGALAPGRNHLGHGGLTIATIRARDLLASCATPMGEYQYRRNRTRMRRIGGPWQKYRDA